MKASTLTAAASLLTVAAAVPSPFTALTSPADIFHKRDACTGNTADNRQTWCDYSISTDYSTTTPDTGVTREYWLELKEATVAPDGFSRTALTFNGTVPGPTLTANWGDTMIIHVKNSLSTNGTSVHWHGLRQLYTNQHDGVVSITQCATAPKDTYTYKFRLTQYGTTWYHSHLSVQAWDGAFGGIVINGPASSNYDEDKGLVILSDWFHKPASSLFDQAQTTGPPSASNGLINGLNVFTADGSTTQTGSRFETAFQPGKSYRLRLVNVAMDSHWKFSIDNHTLTVVAMDLVPVKPYTTNIVNIGIAQRYDVIVNADKSDIAKDFWLRAIPQSSCSQIANANNIRGVIHYGDSKGIPNTTAYAYTDQCVDENYKSLVPFVAKDVSATPFSQTLEQITVGVNPKGLFRWYLNGSTLEVQWGDPTLQQINNNDMKWNTSQNVIQMDETNSWYYVIIQSSLALAHPIHLHGHDFHILSQGTGAVSANTALNLANPPRRDTAILPPAGHLVLAWETDNPGAWLMHCHIGWHTVEGLALQFVERFSEIKQTIDSTLLQNTCNTWNTFASANRIVVEDSGI